VGAILTCMDAAPIANCNDAEIRASSYDQSCLTDGDCVIVGEGQSCGPCSLAYGPFNAINRSALPLFEADVAKTPGGAFDIVSCVPGCDLAVVACCRVGRCGTGAACSN
jgi:hypothetical protein